MGVSKRVVVKEEAKIGRQVKYTGCPSNISFLGIRREKVYTIIDVKKGNYYTFLRLKENKRKAWINSRFFYYVN